MAIGLISFFCHLNQWRKIGQKALATGQLTVAVSTDDRFEIGWSSQIKTSWKVQKQNETESWFFQQFLLETSSQTQLLRLEIDHLLLSRQFRPEVDDFGQKSARWQADCRFWPFFYSLSRYFSLFHFIPFVFSPARWLFCQLLVWLATSWKKSLQRFVLRFFSNVKMF